MFTRSQDAGGRQLNPAAGHVGGAKRLGVDLSTLDMPSIVEKGLFAHVGSDEVTSE